MSGRKRDYSTASETGMEFIGGRWVYAGDKGYRVVFDGTEADGDRCWSVLSYNAAHTRPVHGGRNLTEDNAHAMAARLARLPVHPKPETREMQR